MSIDYLKKKSCPRRTTLVWISSKLNRNISLIPTFHYKSLCRSDQFQFLYYKLLCRSVDPFVDSFSFSHLTLSVSFFLLNYSRLPYYKSLCQQLQFLVALSVGRSVGPVLLFFNVLVSLSKFSKVFKSFSKFSQVFTSF